MATGAPQINSILDNVKTLCAAISTTSTYRNIVKTTNRQLIYPDTLGAGTLLPALLIGIEQRVEFDVAGVGSTPKQVGRLLFKVLGIMKEYASPSTEINDLAQDAREAILSDRDQGGYADNTKIGAVAFSGAEGSAKWYEKKPFISFLMDVEIQFHENL